MLVTPLSVPSVLLVMNAGSRIECSAMYLYLCSPPDSAPDQISPLLNTVVINALVAET